MVVLPAPMLVANPVLLTAATVLEEELHVTKLVTFTIDPSL
jgi:hypothetical protein